MTSRATALAPLLLVAACLGDDKLPPPSGPHYQYVVSDLHVPSTNNLAREYGLDLNGDGTVDNQMGMVFGTLATFGLGVGDTAHEALVRGALIMLADIQTPAFDDTDVTGMTTYRGRDPSPVPCLDPAQLDTCGQHLLGTGEFAVEDRSASDEAAAPIENGKFIGTMDRLPVEIAFVSATPIRVVLHGARVRVTQLTPDGALATVGGGITTADLNRVVFPEAAAEMDRIVMEECVLVDNTPCACPAESRAHVLETTFDANHDCHIAVDEVSKNSLAVSLTYPDMTIDGEDLLSFGVGVELVHASFPTP